MIKKSIFSIISFTVLLTFFSCGSDSASTNGSINFDANNSNVNCEGNINVRCSYDENSGYINLYGYDVLKKSSTTGLPYYENKINFEIYNVENLNDLIGLSIPYHTPSLQNELSFEMSYANVENGSDISGGFCDEAVLTITSVSGGEISGTFSGQCDSDDLGTTNYTITNGTINTVKIQ